MESALERHSGELLILALSILVLGTLMVVVPQLLRAHHRIVEIQHVEHMKALEMGQTLPDRDEPTRAAGRTASLVPIVVICAAGTVTCFLSAYKTENFFAITLAVWSVAGVVCLAAITGGVALVHQLARLRTGQIEEEEEQIAQR
jgi:hypothetical protein